MEVVMAMTIGLLLLAAISPFFAAQWSLAQANTAHIEAMQTARYGMDNMIKDAKNSQQITLSRSGKQIDFLRQGSGNVHVIYYADTDGILRREVSDGSGAQPITGSSIVPTKVTVMFSQSATGLFYVHMTVIATDKRNHEYPISLQTAVKLP